MSVSQEELCSMVSASLIQSESTEEERLLCPCVPFTLYHYWKWNGQVGKKLSSSASYFVAIWFKSRPRNGDNYRDISQTLSITPGRCSNSISNYKTDLSFSNSCQSTIQE